MAHRFHFFRAGGVDQVSLRDGFDILALGELDQKLWVALAMPTKGTSLDPDTLALLDHDNDGRIRVQDILAAVEWVKQTFKQPNDLIAGKDTIELSAIADAKVVVAAKRILSDLGKKTATALTVADTIAINKAFAETVLNGDGIVIQASTDDLDVKHVIDDVIATIGNIADRSGKPGIDKTRADQFFAEVDARASWLTRGKEANLSALADKTPGALAAYGAVRAKIDDYFMRCQITAFDARGAATLGGQDAELLALAGHALTADDAQLADLPLSKIDPAAKLRLDANLNPAWAARMKSFVTTAVTPILGPREVLTAADFATIVARLAPLQTWLDTKPTTKVDGLEVPWIEKLAAPQLRSALAAVIVADEALAADYAQISAATKAVRMQRDFGRILRNFVNFSDFYSKQDGAFQAGTLYLDARALHLCVPVSDSAKHGALAAVSDACLLYCDLTRKGETKQIAAALTNGDADNVFVGRNGIFYDRDGNDWDATITKLVSNPISVRAAFWAPYKKLIRTIEDGVQKRAAAAEAASNAKMEAAGSDVANADKKVLAEATAPPAPPPPEEPKKIDLGTVAAIGVAIGGVGTLFGALFAVLFGLGMWLPLGVLALVLMISGPSMLLAWLKLRRRNLGPILDANGWAVNGRARINVAFGAAMTELAKLPAGSARSLDDPFADKKTPWKRWVLLIIVLGLGGLWYVGKLDAYLPEQATSIDVLGESAPAAKKAAAAAKKAEEPAKPPAAGTSK